MQLRTDYAALQDNAIQQLTQMDSDARLAEMHEQMMQIRAASESTEEKLRSEVRRKGIKCELLLQKVNGEKMSFLFTLSVVFSFLTDICLMPEME